MLEGRTIVAVVPAHDEALLIRQTLEGIPHFVDRIVVVDDGSRDGTGRAARMVSRGIELLEHRENLGVGAAISTGCRHALRIGADVAIVIAADGQMDPADLPSLLGPLLEDEADFVKGNRLGWRGAWRTMPWHRWIGNHGLSLLTRVALRSSTGDSQCGYVALNRRALRAIPWDALWHGYGYPNDLLGHVLLRSLRVREVPVRPVYGEEKSGIRLWHAVVVIPFVISRAWLRRLRGSAIEAPWRTSTSSTVMQTASVRSPSSAMPTRDEAP